MGVKIPVYYDAEFTGLHRNSALISIGLVSECGAYFYAEFTDYDQSQINDWLDEHIIKNLLLNEKGPTFLKRSNPYRLPNEVLRHQNIMIKDSKDKVKNELLGWLYNEAHCPDENHDDQVQFYTDCYAYDWVLLNDLICDDGLALNLPKYINYIPYDLSTLLQSKGYDPDVNREEFIGEAAVGRISRNVAFIRDGYNMKHNSLWDATVAKVCFEKLLKEG